jgi:hypothetical protein
MIRKYQSLLQLNFDYYTLEDAPVKSKQEQLAHEDQMKMINAKRVQYRMKDSIKVLHDHHEEEAVVEEEEQNRFQFHSSDSHNSNNNNLAANDLIFLESLRAHVLLYPANTLQRILHIINDDKNPNSDGIPEGDEEDENESSICEINRHLYRNKVSSSLKQSAITSLDLRDKNISSERGLVLASLIVYCPKLQILQLANNRLDDECLHKLITNLQEMCPGILQLDLSENNVGAKTLSILAHYLCVSKYSIYNMILYS